MPATSLTEIGRSAVQVDGGSRDAREERFIAQNARNGAEILSTQADASQERSENKSRPAPLGMTARRDLGMAGTHGVPLQAGDRSRVDCGDL